VNEVWLIALGGGLCAASALVLLGLAAAVVWQGEQGATPLVDLDRPSPRGAAAGHKRRRIGGLGRGGDYVRFRHPPALGLFALILVLAVFGATAVWLASLGWSALGMGAAVEFALEGLNR
jgi:hypothetical protein